MIWLNPWAWLGVLGVALPMAIHLLGRGHATTRKFPTLRFIEPSRLLPTRRTRIHDAALLLIRALILVVAVAALAQPFWLTPERRQSLDRGVARVVILDTTWSMRQPSASGRPALDVARDSAKVLATAAQAGVVVETAVPGRSLAASVRWMARQQRRGEIVVLSDYQAGSIDSTDVSGVPPTVALNLIPIRTAARPATSQREFRTANGVVTVSTVIGAERSTSAWSAIRGSAAPPSVALLGGSGDGDRLEATRAATAAIGTSTAVDTSRSIAIVFSRYPDRASLRSKVKPVTQPWAKSLVSALLEASINVEAVGEGELGGRRSLVLFTTAEPGTLASAQLLASVEGRRSTEPGPRELDPSFIEDSRLREWSHGRSAVTDSPPSPDLSTAPSDARWLWGLVLILLGAETMMRRQRRAGAAALEDLKRAA